MLSARNYFENNIRTINTPKYFSLNPLSGTTEDLKILIPPMTKSYLRHWPSYLTLYT